MPYMKLDSEREIGQFSPSQNRLGEIPDQSESADSFQGSGTGWNGTFQSFLSELIPVDSQYLVKTSINYAIKRLKTIV